MPTAINRDLQGGHRFDPGWLHLGTDRLLLGTSDLVLGMTGLRFPDLPLGRPSP